jgi:hypothetical protein
MPLNPISRYQISYTTADKNPISIPRKTIVGGVSDIIFIGKDRLEYGEVFNNNEVHLLEHFACPESTKKPGTPDLAQAIAPKLRKPTVGQIWYNKTQNRPFVWNGVSWVQTFVPKSASGNSGVLMHEQYIPMPKNLSTGYVYKPEECAWNVSPFGLTGPHKLTYIECYTDMNAKVFMQYKVQGSDDVIPGLANFVIASIKGAKIISKPAPTPNIPGATPTPTVTPTPSPSSTAVMTPTVTPTISRTPAYTRPATPTPTVTKTVTPYPSVTRTVTPTPTVTGTVTPTVSPSVPPPIWISLTDMNRIATTTVGSDFTVGYRVLDTGTIVIYSTDGMEMPIQYIMNDSPLNYSVMVTQLENNIALDGDVDDWLLAGITRVWEIRTDQSTLAGVYYNKFQIQVIRNVDQQIMETAIVTLQINVQ